MRRADLLSRRRAPKRRIDYALQTSSLASGAWRRELGFGVAAELYRSDRFGSGRRVAYLDLLAFGACLDRPMDGSAKRIPSHGRHVEQINRACGRVGKVARVVAVRWSRCFRAVNQAVIQQNVNRPEASRGGERPRIRRGRRRGWSLQLGLRLCRKDACVANINMMRRWGEVGDSGVPHGRGVCDGVALADAGQRFPLARSQRL